MVEKASVKPRSHVPEGILNPQNKKEFKSVRKERRRPACLIPPDLMADTGVLFVH